MARTARRRRGDRQPTAFGTRLVRILNDRQMTDSELARQLGVAQPNIHTLKFKTKKPRSATVERLAEILNVSVDELTPGGSVVASVGRAVAAKVAGRVARGVSIPKDLEITLVVKSKAGGKQTIRLV